MDKSKVARLLLAHPILAIYPVTVDPKPDSLCVLHTVDMILTELIWQTLNHALIALNIIMQPS